MTSTLFRNIDFDYDADVSEWPVEAIETVLDRGQLSEWRRLAADIKNHPWGYVARTVVELVESHDYYGIGPAMQRVIADARAAVDQAGRERFAVRIREWRRQTGMNQADFAATVGTSASRLSAYENARVAPTTDILGRIEQLASRQ